MKLTLQLQAVKNSRIKSSLAAEIAFERAKPHERPDWIHQCLRANITGVERTRDSRIRRTLHDCAAVGKDRHLVGCNFETKEEVILPYAWHGARQPLL